VTRVTDFIHHNKRSPVVSGAAIGNGGRGAYYRLANGQAFTLTRAECEALPPTFPRWHFGGQMQRPVTLAEAQEARR